MLKKLLTGCLTIAMIGAFSASASAEATLTWSGNATATLQQTSDKDGTGDAKVEMDMYATGDLDLTAAVAGDTWTGTAYLDFDFSSKPDPEDQKIVIDDVYVKMSNDTMAISFGEFDPVGVGKGWEYVADIDESYGAGGFGGGDDDVPNEQGWLMLSLTDVGLDLFIGMNQVQKGEADITSTDYDASNDGQVASTAYGVTFDKSFGDLALAVEYVAAGFTRDEENGDHVKEDSKWDGASVSEIALAVQYSLGNMAFVFNYASQNTTYGGDGNEDLKKAWMELVFDMALSDTQGLTAGYGMKTQDQDETNYAGSDLHLSFMLATGGASHYFTYWSSTWKEEDADDADEDSKIGYSMKVSF